MQGRIRVGRWLAFSVTQRFDGPASSGGRAPEPVRYHSGSRQLEIWS
jgi:hypothetical protein